MSYTFPGKAEKSVLCLFGAVEQIVRGIFGAVEKIVRGLSGGRSKNCPPFGGGSENYSLTAEGMPDNSFIPGVSGAGASGD